MAIMANITLLSYLTVTDIQSTWETVYYCSTAEAFSAAITEALNNNSKQCISQRLQVAEANTWVRRAAEFEEILRENYPV